MALISSHLLNAVNGTHAAGVAVSLFRVGQNYERELIFQAETDAGGRLREEIASSSGRDEADFELVFRLASYFDANGLNVSGKQTVRRAVVQFRVPDPSGLYHFPLIVSPHGYSIWWSSL